MTGQTHSINWNNPGAATGDAPPPPGSAAALAPSTWISPWPEGPSGTSYSHPGDGTTPLGYPNRITAAEWRDNFQPAVAYDETDDQYLVVWMADADGDGKRYEIGFSPARCLRILDNYFGDGK